MTVRPSPEELVVRPYRPADRSAVREICHRTGYMGEPVDWQWRDVDSFADMFTGYYTDCEPESAYVVEVDGVVGGYLLGCTNAVKAWNPVAVAGRHILRRGIVFRPGTARVVWRAFGDIGADLAARRINRHELQRVDPRWPAEMHIDLLPPARGRGVGRRLVNCWFDALRAQGIPGCHLGTFAENAGAIRFFEAVGFHRIGTPQPVPGLRTRTGGRLHGQTLAADIG